ncbi:MAG: hypothetical protein WC777_00885 [Candidatus Gracilibacteria bacterium]|jgi:hypothetical protein
MSDHPSAVPEETPEIPVAPGVPRQPDPVEQRVDEITQICAAVRGSMAPTINPENWTRAYQF